MPNSRRLLPRLVRALPPSLALTLFASFASAAASPEASPPATPAAPAREWDLATIIFGNEGHERMALEIDKGRITGWISRRGKRLPIAGTSDKGAVRFEVNEGGEKALYTGRVEGEAISGTVVVSGPEVWGEEPPAPWRARRIPPDAARPSGPRTIDFDPSEFHRVFSASIPPVLRIWPGDVVRTKTVDAGGVDEKMRTRVLGGNPQTGPFYVEGAMPGDVVAIHIRKLRLNRATAISDDGIVDRALTTDYASEHPENDFKSVVWSLDLDKGTASPAKPTERLKGLAVPVRPMLGCVAVAPGFGGAPIRTGDSGRIGGNMDFSEVREGATVYLQVGQPGALIYVGDGHALQGDGELNGNALETSLDVELSVDLLREKRIPGPRVENAEHLMAMGLAGSLDQAFRDAGSDLAGWLQQDYGLTASETAILLGATIEYQISEVADRNVGVVAKIRKKYLPAAAGAVKR
ncbi:MAG: acetamidase/formamidase family protein [Acidobacteriota bacterium]